MIIPSSARGLRDLSRLIKKSSYRRERGLFVAEGEKIFFELPAKDILQVFFSRTYFSSHQNRLIPRLFRLPYDVLEDSVFEKISDTVTPQGVLSVISYPSYRPEDLVEAAKKSGGILLVLEGIQDPGNLGTIFRSARGAGCRGIFMDEKTADLFNPKVVRSSMGAVLHVPFYYEKEWNRRLAYLKEEGFILYAAHLEGDLLYDEADCTGCCAFLIGNESAGLARETIARADAGIRIPLSEGAESLNAGVAASILLFEADRQRRRRDGG